jgi:uncharacterized RmlC-like cupin family protein
MTPEPVPQRSCRVVRAGAETSRPQGTVYAAGISAESVGALGLCMTVGTIPPGSRAVPHLHEEHETAIYLISGHVAMHFGDGLAERVEVGPGDLLYIPAGVAHRPYNLSGTEPARFVVARTDPHEDESTTLLPEGDAPA